MREARWTLRSMAIRAIGVVTVAVLVPLVGAAPASATTLQTTVQPPIDGRVTSSPDEPHHTPYDGDYAYDVAATGNVYARFRNTNGGLSLSVASIRRACGSGAFADGGDRIVLNVVINGTKVGTVAYSHLTDFSFNVGAQVPVGARIARVATTGDGLRANSCWTGSHVHVEPRNDVRYGCYFAEQLGRTVNGSNALGIVGGERAGARNVACAAGSETPATVGEGSFIRRPDGAIFRIAGGAPIYVSTWDAFGGPQPFIEVSWEYYNALPQAPANNSFLVGSRTGRVFRIVADGHRYYVASWDPYGGPQPTTAVDDWALDNCDHMRCDPFGAYDALEGIPGGIRVSGWAMDPDSTDPIAIHVYANGTMIDDFVANRSRPDVDDVFHRGANYGFDERIATSAERLRVCVYGINVGQGLGNPELGCRDVDALPRHVAKVSIAAPSKARAPKEPVRIRGRLLLDGEPAAGRSVTLLKFKKAVDTWVSVGSAITAVPEDDLRTGRVQFTVSERKTRTYRIQFEGAFDAAPGSSATLRVARH